MKIALRRIAALFSKTECIKLFIEKPDQILFEAFCKIVLHGNQMVVTFIENAMNGASMFCKSTG